MTSPLNFGSMLLLLSTALQAQTGVLTGTIIDELLTPIAPAKVSLTRDGRKTETTTDERGRFRFEKLTAGTYEMKVEVPDSKSAP